MKQLFYVLVFMFSSTIVFGQDRPVQEVEDEYDLLFTDSLPDIDVEPIVVIARSEDYNRKLRRDVLRAYPYAIRIVTITEQMDAHLATLKKKKHRKRYTKAKEEILKEMFEERMRKMTKRQGRILVRLINRELEGEKTAYDLIKQYRNGLHARFWQIVAKKYDSNLKAQYDPDNVESEDFRIEGIVEEIEDLYRRTYSRNIDIKAPTYRDLQP